MLFFACNLAASADLSFSGKTLGGSTSINGAHYTRGMQAQYDAWTTLLEISAADAGWDWEGILGYMQKVRWSSLRLRFFPCIVFLSV